MRQHILNGLGKSPIYSTVSPNQVPDNSTRFRYDYSPEDDLPVTGVPEHITWTGVRCSSGLSADAVTAASFTLLESVSANQACQVQVGVQYSSVKSQFVCDAFAHHELHHCPLR
jgi:hypothetical protein